MEFTPEELNYIKRGLKSIKVWSSKQEEEIKSLRQRFKDYKNDLDFENNKLPHEKM